MPADFDHNNDNNLDEHHHLDGDGRAMLVGPITSIEYWHIGVGVSSTEEDTLMFLNLKTLLKISGTVY